MLLIFLCYREVLRLLPGLARQLRGGKLKGILLGVGILILFLPAGLLVARGPNPLETAAPRPSAAISQPNILLLTSDGVNAENMSVYGYRRDTTPFLKELAQTSLVAENALTNAGKTYGSILSFYTGKNPVTTGVIFTPNILKGADSYQHLPGLLRSAGYRTVEITTPHYADAYSMNLLDGFDEVNGQSMSSAALTGHFKPLSPLSPWPISFTKPATRITARLGHIFYLKDHGKPIYSGDRCKPDTLTTPAACTSLDPGDRDLKAACFLRMSILWARTGRGSRSAKRFFPSGHGSNFEAMGYRSLR